MRLPIAIVEVTDHEENNTNFKYYRTYAKPACIKSLTDCLGISHFC
jgi:hypothetical protein